MGAINQLWQRTLTSAMLVTIFGTIYFCCAPIYFSVLVAVIALYILLIEWPRFCIAPMQSLWFLTPMYPLLPFIGMVYINHYAHQLILPLFVAVSAFDTGSYLVGSTIGSWLIAPAISPKKSWQGAIGGYFLATICVLLLFWLNPTQVPIFFTQCSLLFKIGALLINNLGICACALLGDLFESWLKRKAGIKDSGTLLAGHGGLLDRFDGLMFATFLLLLLSLLL